MSSVEQSKESVPTRSPVVLAAVDESSTAEGVVQRALGLAASMGAELHVVRVIEVVPTIALGGSSMLVPSAARLVQQAWLDLDRLLPGDGQSEVVCKGHVAVGNPGQKVVQMATDLEAEVLVIGTHDPGKVASTLFGSVAMELVRKAPCPVFVERPRRHLLAGASASPASGPDDRGGPTGAGHR